MKVTRENRLRTSVLAAILIASTGMIGCASTQEMQNMQAQIDSASADAQAAKAEAAEAKALAQSAVNTANDANATSKATEAKIDRMFKKAMYK